MTSRPSRPEVRRCRYDTTGGQFIYNWKTPGSAGQCYRVTMATQDLTTLVAYFKLK